MSDFDTIRFPPEISINAVGGPRFKTSVVVMANGREARRQWWETERGEWTVSHRARRPADWQRLLSFFRAIAQGQSNTFRFKDWTDYVCESGEGFFQAAEYGSPLGQQMVKRYTFDGFTYDRVIAKPISGKITTDAVALDYATGVATSGTYWYGEFDVWARLNSDIAQMQMIDKSGRTEDGRPELIVGWDGIEIVEVIYEDR